MREQYISDSMWALIEPLVPRYVGAGRPPIHSSREVLEGISWVLNTGARWSDLPEGCPSYSTCHRRYRQWVEKGVFASMVEHLVEVLYLKEPEGKTEGEPDVGSGICFIDGSFIPGKKGEIRSGALSTRKLRSVHPPRLLSNTTQTHYKMTSIN